jgi:hypothetical protein
MIGTGGIAMAASIMKHGTCMIAGCKIAAGEPDRMSGARTAKRVICAARIKTSQSSGPLTKANPMYAGKAALKEKFGAKLARRCRMERVPNRTVGKATALKQDMAEKAEVGIEGSRD